MFVYFSVFRDGSRQYYYGCEVKKKRKRQGQSN